MTLVTPFPGKASRLAPFTSPRRAARPHGRMAGAGRAPATGARTAFRVTLLALGAACALAALAASARAGQSRMLIIPADDGYGFGECFTNHSACGAMAASAWCEANGLKGVQGFGRAEELPAGTAAPGSFYVSCSDAS